MLKHLLIDNYILINHLEFSLDANFLAITGETGAGKSIFINAISLISGDRLSSNVVLDPSKKTLIEGVFEFKNTSHAYQKMIEFGFEMDEEDHIFSREVSADGRSVYRIDRKQVSLSIVKEILTSEIDIHSQFNTQRLLNESEHLRLLDKFLNNDELLINVKELYSKYQEALNKKQNYQNSLKELNNIDEITKQVSEIEILNPSIEDETNLLHQVNEMSQFEKELEAYQNINQLLLTIDTGALYGLKDSTSNDEINELLASSYYQLEEVSRLVEKKLLTANLDEHLLEQLNQRIFEYNRLKRKYKMSTEEMCKFLDESKLLIEELSDSERVLRELDIKIHKAYEVFIGEAKKLSQLRRDKAKELSKLISKHGKDLSLNAVDFRIEFSDSISLNGLETCRFMVSLNKGIEPGPLNKVASGGELSRLMLILKVIFNDIMEIGLIIFDEIDAGVSGNVAKEMALKMSQLASKSTVICVTHLAIVASYAEKQYLISKSNSNVDIELLDEHKRIEQLAIMMSSKNDKAALLLAKNLLDESTMEKQNVC